jgi:tyrosyl-tRNA synthetase
LVHGGDELARAEIITEVLVGARTIADLDDGTLEVMRKEVASTHAQPGTEIAELLTITGLAASKTEARRLLADNAISINGVKIQKEHLEESDFQGGRLLLRKGKAFKDSALIEQG